MQPPLAGRGGGGERGGRGGAQSSPTRPSLSWDRKGLTGAEGLGGAGGAGAHQFRIHLLCSKGGERGGGRRREGWGKSAGEDLKTPKSGELCALLTAEPGKLGAWKVSLQDFGEIEIKQRGKAVAFWLLIPTGTRFKVSLKAEFKCQVTERGPGEGGLGTNAVCFHLKLGEAAPQILGGLRRFAGGPSWVGEVRTTRASPSTWSPESGGTT